MGVPAMTSPQAIGDVIGEWRAVNRAHASTGSIHDDATARKLGFRGGFVGGVTIVSYVCEGWRRARNLPLALAPFRMTVDLRGPLYEGETARVRASADGPRWRYAVESDNAQVTTDGEIESLNAVVWPDAAATGESIALDGVDLSALPVRERTFDLDEAYRYYTDVLGAPVSREAALPVSVGLWANPMAQVIDRLKATHTTVHRSSEMLVQRLPVTRAPYRFVDSVERVEVRTDGKALVHVRCAVVDPAGECIAVVLHRSAVRRRT